MSKSKRFLTTLLFAALVFFAVLIFGLGNEPVKAEKKPSLVPHLTAGGYVQVVAKDGTDYKILFSADTRQSDADLAKEVAKIINSGTGAGVRALPDTASKETEFEILIGDTNRGASRELLESIKTKGDAGDVLAWGYSFSNGKLCYTANCDIAFSIGMKDFLELFSSDGTLLIPGDLFEIHTKSREEYDKEQAELAEAERQEYLRELKKMNAEFSDDQFNVDTYLGALYKPMIGDDGWVKKTQSGEPWIYPASNNHPVYLITSDKIDDLRQILSEGQEVGSEYFFLAKNFWEKANADETVHKWGVIPVTNKNGGTYRYDESIIATIDSKALAYLITGNEVYAYEALVILKNAILTIDYNTLNFMDTYHGYSRLMVAVCAVYDWCYDILPDEDKWQLIWGTAQLLGPRMEMKYPPTQMNGVSGHGTGPQLLRDWMSLAAVFYDEAPDWWRFVAGRFFNEYLPVANIQYQNGWISQGTAGYGIWKPFWQVWANIIVENATGEVFLTEDTRLTMYNLMGHLIPQYGKANTYDERVFSTGDGQGNLTGTRVDPIALFAIAAYYDDPTLLAFAKQITNGYKVHQAPSTQTTLTMTPALQLCFISQVTDRNVGDKNFKEGLETIQYFGTPAATITARESWSDDSSVVVLMKLANMTMANHDIQDHGTFQIYYKGFLTSASGSYNKYGSTHHQYYHQATVSANGLLIYNPASADTAPVYNCQTAHEHSPSTCKISNASRYYYSGGQRRLGEAGSYDNWTSGNYVMSETTGAAYGYNKDGSPKYAYIAGDLTKAYVSTAVNYVGRSMFTLFTGDENFPVLFFTYDQMNSLSENYTKHWLLHSYYEPVIDENNLTATLQSTTKEGELRVKSLFGADAIVKIGGEGKAWWINGDVSKNLTSTDIGKNLIDEYHTDDEADKIWGRVELRAVGEKYTAMLTAMAVTDAGNAAEFEIEKFTNSDGNIYGAKYKNSIIAFTSDSAKPGQKIYETFKIETSGKGLHDYYIMGVEAGTWKVSIDGIAVANAYADEESGMLMFTAPAGELTIAPTDNVMGVNGGKIEYETDGGVLPTGTTRTYNNTADFPINAVPTRGEDKFAGWYTSADYNPKSAVTAIPKGTLGTYTVYAKWISNFLNEDYSEVEIDNVDMKNEAVNGITYAAGDKTGASFITKTDSNGKKYLEWVEGSADPFIMSTSTTKNFSMIVSDEKCVSFTINLRLNATKPCISTDFRLIAKQDVNGNSIGSAAFQPFFTDTSGNVTTYSGKSYLPLSSEKVTSIRFVVDFKNTEIRYYDDSLNVVITDKITPPEATGAKNGEELMKCLTQYIFYFYARSPLSDTNNTLHIYGIRVQEGDEFKK